MRSLPSFGRQASAKTKGIYRAKAQRDFSLCDFPSLRAKKNHAKPAYRRQGFMGFTNFFESFLLCERLLFF